MLRAWPHASFVRGIEKVEGIAAGDTFPLALHVRCDHARARHPKAETSLHLPKPPLTRPPCCDAPQPVLICVC